MECSWCCNCALVVLLLRTRGTAIPCSRLTLCINVVPKKTAKYSLNCIDSTCSTSTERDWPWPSCREQRQRSTRCDRGICRRCPMPRRASGNVGTHRMSMAGVLLVLLNASISSGDLVSFRLILLYITAITATTPKAIVVSKRLCASFSMRRSWMRVGRHFCFLLRFSTSPHIYDHVQPASMRRPASIRARKCLKSVASLDCSQRALDLESTCRVARFLVGYRLLTLTTFTS